MLGEAHVASVTVALLLALVVLGLQKGTSRHVAWGRAYVAVLTAGNVAALLTREESGGLGPFHVLAVISLLTLTGGVVTSPRRRRGARAAHSRFMLWSVVGLTTAGLAQLANSLFPEQEPWPVLLVTATSVVVGSVLVPAAADRGVRRLPGSA